MAAAQPTTTVQPPQFVVAGPGGRKTGTIIETFKCEVCNQVFQSMGALQVWLLTLFFLSLFSEKSLICMEGKSMTPHRGNTIFCSSSQQLPRLRLGTLKGFLS